MTCIVQFVYLWYIMLHYCIQLVLDIYMLTFDLGPLTQNLFTFILTRQKCTHVWERLTKWIVQWQSLSTAATSRFPVGTKMAKNLYVLMIVTAQWNLKGTRLRNCLKIYLILGVSMSTTVRLITVHSPDVNIKATTSQYHFCVSWNAHNSRHYNGRAAIYSQV